MVKGSGGLASPANSPFFLSYFVQERGGLLNRLSRQSGVARGASGAGLEHLGEGLELSDTFLERVGMLLGKIYAGKRAGDWANLVIWGGAGSFGKSVCAVMLFHQPGSVYPFHPDPPPIAQCRRFP